MILTVKHGGGGVVIQACFADMGTFPLGCMNSSVYLNIEELSVGLVTVELVFYCKP